MAIANRSLSDWLGAEAELILNTQPRVSRERLHLPNAHVVDRFSLSDRNPQVLRSIQQMYGSGRLANTGYLSILPVDQGIRSTRASSTLRPIPSLPTPTISIARRLSSWLSRPAAMRCAPLSAFWDPWPGSGHTAFHSW